MAGNRAAAVAGLVVVILAAALALVLTGARDVAAPSPSASPTSTAATAAPTPSASPSATSFASATPFTGGRYASPLGYSIDLPAPWHHSSCAVLTQQSPEPMGEEFVPVAVRDEMGTDIGSAYSTLRVFAEANPQNISPRQWAEQGKTIGGTAGERVEDVTYAGRPARARRSLERRSRPTSWSTVVA